ncbi:hypothetical protein [Streptomyces spiramyceticus]|uniref:hypothetical protein n=1 Tax=Streptomyces spiramyceticus TaxID=299717 RepID=UPI00237B9633|nr:hypothetical protein [Streptomyces spiramyceticus]
MNRSLGWTNQREERLDLALQGFRDALARCYRRMQDYLNKTSNLGAEFRYAIIPVVEALWWAVSADEELMDYHGRDKRSKYFQERQRFNNADGVLLGVIYARNRCGHQRALIANDMSFRFGVPDRGFNQGRFGPAIVWREFNELPQPNRGASSAGAQQYQDHLQDALVMDTLEQVAAWFNRAQQSWVAN